MKVNTKLRCGRIQKTITIKRIDMLISKMKVLYNYTIQMESKTKPRRKNDLF